MSTLLQDCHSDAPLAARGLARHTQSIEPRSAQPCTFALVLPLAGGAITQRRFEFLLSSNGSRKLPYCSAQLGCNHVASPG